MENLPPNETIRRAAGGYILSQCLHVVADLGIADYFDDTPRLAAEVAEQIGANADALERILRVLAGYGIFEVQADGIRHTPASRLLRTDDPHSLRAFIRMFVSGLNWINYGEFEHTLMTGRPASEVHYPDGLWAYRAEHPEEAKMFNASMESRARSRIPDILAFYDFTQFRTVCDVGGGLGHLLRAIIGVLPHIQGLLYDLPYVLEEAARTPSERLTFLPGNFLKDELPTADAYLLMDILHDWGDAQASQILAAVHTYAPAGSKLLVIEEIVPEEPSAEGAEILNVHMLTFFGGRQRALSQLQTLLSAAGFLFLRSIRLPVGVSIVEAVTEK
jgi:hypothetical protein